MNFGQKTFTDFSKDNPTGHQSSTMESRDPDSPSANSTSSKTVREVDYYFNPTELFRWINYRRWDGARTRILSNPDECATWIVSRHSTDGRILWRHLPLHLVCMQSGLNAASSSSLSNENEQSGNKDNKVIHSAIQQRQIEDLIDILLEAYPEGASSPDDQGMLPLHLCVTNNLNPNDRVINLLLMVNPSAVEVKDKFGRTPLDLLRDNKSGKNESALRAMTRAQRMSKRLVSIIRKENSGKVDEVKKWADNEREASKRIIMRMEEELQHVNKELEKYQSQTCTEKNRGRDLELQIDLLQNRVDELELDVDQVRKERDELVKNNEHLTGSFVEQENKVNEIKQKYQLEKEEQQTRVATLKSEVNTARSMAEAMESQLRARFENEEFLTNEVSDLETKMNTLSAQYQQDTKRLEHDLEACTQENEILKKNCQDFAAKLFNLQNRLSEMNKHVENVVTSHGALNSEHDRLMDISVRYESELLRSAQAGRSAIETAIKKQQEVFEATMKEQRVALEKATEKEAKLIEMAKNERHRGMEVVNRMRQDFREMRKLATEQELKIQQQSLSLGRNRKFKGNNEDEPSEKESRTPQASSTMSLNSSLMKPNVLLRDRSILDQSDSQSLSSPAQRQDSLPEQRLPSSTQSKSESKGTSVIVTSSPEMPSLDSKVVEKNHGSVISKKQNQSRPIYSPAPSTETETTANRSKEQRSFRPESRIPSTHSFSSTSIESVTPRDRPTPQSRGQLLHLIEDRAERDEATRGKGFSSTKRHSRDKFSFVHEKNSNTAVMDKQGPHTVKFAPPMEALKPAPVRVNSPHSLYYDNEYSDASSSDTFSGAPESKFGKYVNRGYGNSKNFSSSSSKDFDDDSSSSFNRRYGIERIPTVNERRTEDISTPGGSISNSDDESSLGPLR